MILFKYKPIADMLTRLHCYRPSGVIVRKMTTENRLRHQLSPYLLQHKTNPVDWYPWSEEALTDLLTELRGRVRTKMTRRGKRKFKKEKSGEQSTVAASQQDNLVLLHSGILGLCSFIEGRNKKETRDIK